MSDDNVILRHQGWKDKGRPIGGFRSSSSDSMPDVVQARGRELWESHRGCISKADPNLQKQRPQGSRFQMEEFLLILRVQPESTLSNPCSWQARVAWLTLLRLLEQMSEIKH